MKNPQFKKMWPLIFYTFITIALCILFYFIIARIGAIRAFVGEIVSILLPFFIGAAFAFLLKPLCNFLDRRLGDLFAQKIFARTIRRGRTTDSRVRSVVEKIDVFLSFLFLVSIIYFIISLIIPRFYDSVLVFAANLGKYIDTFAAWLSDLFESNAQIQQYIQTAMEKLESFLLNFVNDSILPNLENVATGTIAVGKMILNTLLNIVVSSVVTVYLLLSRKKLAIQAQMILYTLFRKSWADKIMEEARFADKTFSGYIGGKMLDSALVGIILFIALTIFKIPQPALIAIIMGCLNVIPFFGPYFGSIPCTLLILMLDPIKAIWFLIIVVVVQQLDGNILDPYVVGDSIGLPSFWVLFAVLLFGGLYGFVGMILGAPIFAIFYHIVRQLVDRGLRKNGMGEMMEAYNYIYHNPKDERAARIKRTRAIKEARKLALERSIVPQSELEDDGYFTPVDDSSEKTEKSEKEKTEDTGSDESEKPQ